MQVQYNQSGFSVFGDIQSGTGLFSVAANSTNAGTGLLASVTVLNSSAIKDHYTLSMITNAAGKLAYQVVDDTTGLMVIPAAPADAPEYIPGSTLTFNGVSTQLTGAPEEGDTFTIAPSTTQSVFKTLQNVIDALNTPMTSPQTRAAVNQILLEQTASFNGAFNHLVDESTKFGMRAQHIDNQMNLNNDNILQQKIYLSSLSDVDLPEAISNLSLQLTSLEMSQQSYSKLQELFTHLMSQQF
jgi:flagellar hook-associated protein 3 FlgL